MFYEISGVLHGVSIGFKGVRGGLKNVLGCLIWYLEAFKEIFEALQGISEVF